MCFLNWFWGLGNWFSNLIRFKAANYCISISKERTGSPWDDQAIEISTLSLLETPKQPLISKGLSVYVYDTFEHFCQTNKYKDWPVLPNATGQSE